ncbi:MAG: hypothetical protein E7525_07090 [Ruminococcaceae bacterium]|nr:hypothetical protein [Oscillospiraceae bacterium]
MSFSNETIKKALDELFKRRKNAETAHERLLENLQLSNPQLRDLENEISKISSKFALTMISGDPADAEKLLSKIKVLNETKDKLLSSLGVPKTPEYTCKLCNDSGYVNGVLCRCVKELAAEMSYSKLVSEMPLKDSTFANFDLSLYPEERNEQGVSPRNQMTAALRCCKEFVEKFPSGGNLLLTGKSGLGKTHLSLAIVNAILEKNSNVIYGSAQNLINEVSRETFDRSGSTEIIDSLLSCDLLVLDDLGTEFSTPLSVSVVYNIINTRLLRGLSTIISTNLNLNEIGQVYNDRITSRLIGSYAVCPCFGNDIRQIKSVNRK